MTPRRWLAVLIVVGISIFALSFVNAWIDHDREVRGEGYRFVHHSVSAWRGVGMPVLTLGVLTSLAVALGAALSLFGSSLRVAPSLLVAGSSLAGGLVLSSAWPLSHDGHASSVDLSPGIVLPVGLVLAILMVVAAVAIARPSRRAMSSALVMGLVAIGAGVLGRSWTLAAGEGTGRHWSDGSYTRTATDGEPTETLTVAGARISIGERWSGSWEWSGWTVVIDNDPACPDSRGAYHAHGVGDEDLRFVKVVDTCQDGARAEDLETGTWERDS